MEDNGWAEWKRYVLAKLEDLSSDVEKIKDSLVEKDKEIINQLHMIRDEIQTIKIKSGLWGVLAGSIPPILAAIFLFLKGSS